MFKWTKLRENSGTVQRLNEFYEWFRRIARSGIESQWEIVLRSQSTSDDSKFSLHAEPRQTLATRYMEFTRTAGTFFGNQFSTFEYRPKIIIKEFTIVRHQERQGQLHKRQGQGLLSQEVEKQHRSTFTRRPSSMTSRFLVDIPHKSMVGQQRRHISELHFDKFSTPQSCLCLKITFKNQVTTCSVFPSEAVLWIKEVEMVESLDEFKSSRFVPIQEEGQTRGTESQDRGLVSTRKTDRLHDLRLLSSYWRSWYRTGLRRIYSLSLFVTIMFRDSDKMGWSSTFYVKDSVRGFLGKSAQIENMWVCATQNCLRNERQRDSFRDVDAQM